MADTTTQIVNKNILWTDYVANSQTLFTTNASTRYVIKDMEVADNSYPTAPSVVVNNTKVATLSGSLTGTEIIDVNSSVNLTYDTSTARYLNVNDITGGTSYASGTTDGAVFLTPTGFTANSATLNTAVSMSGLNSNVIGAWLLNGNFYYFISDGNSTQGFYRRAGGPNGTQSTIYENSYSPCVFDGVSKFYYLNGSTVYMYDTATSSSSYIGSFTTGTTYPLLMFSNGYLFFSPSYTGYNVLYWLNVTTYASGSFGTNTTQYSSLVGSVAFYDASTSLLTFNVGNQTSFSTGYYNYVISLAGTNPTFVSNSQSAFNSAKSFCYNSNCPTNGNYAIMLGSGGGTSNTIHIVDSSMTIVSSKTISGASFSTGSSNVGSCNFFTPSAPVQLAVSPSMRLRITGVQTV
jgi:hypothetical protein